MKIVLMTIRYWNERTAFMNSLQAKVTRFIHTISFNKSLKLNAFTSSVLVLFHLCHPVTHVENYCSYVLSKHLHRSCSSSVKEQ